MNVFEFDAYRPWIKDWIATQPRGGYGVYSQIAAFIGASSVVVSQVIKGSRDLTPEQAVKVSQFMGLSTKEADYFLLLVQKERAGSVELKQMYLRQISEARIASQFIKNRIEFKKLSEEDESYFYSSWHVIATWLALPVETLASLKVLSMHFRIPESELVRTVQFLLDRELLVKRDGKFEFGPNVIHVAHDSPHVQRHHLNWRLKAMQSIDARKAENLFYTAPMSMSRELRAKIREKLVAFIQTQTKAVAASPSEELVCLNIDFFDY